MKQEKVRKIFQKIFKIILFIFLFLLFPSVFSLTINWWDRLNIWPIIGSWWVWEFDINDKILYTDQWHYLNSVTDFFCSAYEDTENTNCLLAHWHDTFFYFHDLKIREKFNSWNLKIAESSKWYKIYYDIDSNSLKLNINNNFIKLIDLWGLRNCWEQNPNNCLFVFTTSWFAFDRPWFHWIYLRYVDTYIYKWDKEPTMQRYYLDSSQWNESIFDWWDSIERWWQDYNWWYWARIWDINYSSFCFAKDEGDITCHEKNSSWFVKINRTHWPIHWSSWFIVDSFFRNKVVFLKNPTFEKDNNWIYTDVIIRDFLVWNKKHLKRTIKDIVWDFTIKSNIAWKNNATWNPENQSNNSDINCEWINFWCYISSWIKVLTSSISWLFTSFFDWIKNIFSSIFKSILSFFWFDDWVLSSIKSFFAWLKDVFLSLWEWFKKVIKFTWDVITFKYSISDINTVWQDYLCSKINFSFFQEHFEFRTEKPLNILLYSLSFINPFPPPENSKICTSLWIKQINYWRNTIIDNFLLSFFFVLVILFAFKSFKKYS